MEKEHVKKREDYISWSNYFMELAKLTSKRSKDPSSQVGACIVNKENKIIGVGYNGLPNGMNDDDFNWSRNNDFLDSKYPYICHAEMNAIFNSNQILNLKDTIIYTTLYPCNECAKLIVQSGINKVFYLENKYANKPSFIASKRILESCNIEVIQFISS
jgi:dCMP deaminase